jgi:FtsH-binding integral membrane protein
MAWQNSLESSLPVEQVLIEESQRTFMSRVYRWMFAGLAITGGMAFYTLTNEALLGFVMKSYWILLIAEFGLVLALSFMVRRLSGAAAALMFVAYAALNGLTLSGIFLAYRLGSVAQAFFVTAGVFGAMSVYGTVTKKDLSSWRSFLYMGLFGLLIAGVVNLFFHSGILSFVWSCVSVVVFTGLTAYDTQKLREMHQVGGETGVAALPIVGALRLYLDFINLFLSLLNLFGKRR